MSRQESVHVLFEKVDEVNMVEYLDPARFIPIKGVSCCVTPSGKIDFIPLFGIYRQADTTTTEVSLRLSIMDLLHEMRTASRPMIPSAQYVDDDTHIEWNGNRYKVGYEFSLVRDVVTRLVSISHREIMRLLPHMNYWEATVHDETIWSLQNFNEGRIGVTKCKYTFIHAVMDAFQRIFNGQIGRTHEYTLHKCEGSLVWSNGVTIIVKARNDARVLLMESLAKHCRSTFWS